MSSANRSVANTERGSQYYVNIATLGSTTSADTYDATGAVISGGAVTDGMTVGQCLVRDMGKTLRVPINTSVINTAGTTKYRVLRKVQLVSAASMDYASTNSGNSNTDGVLNTAGSSNKLLAGGTFYIELSPTAVAGTALRVAWARTIIPN